MPVSLPYVVMVLFYAALAFVAHYKSDETIRLRIDGICILVFLFFFGLRGFVGYDWSSYYPEFTHSPELSYLFATPLRFWRWEPGYTIFLLSCSY